MGDSINPFVVLGVDETATVEEITAAHRARAKVLHPDGLHDGSVEDRAAAEAAMAELNHAYQLLTDDKVRKQYQRVQKRRRAAAARRGEQLPQHPSRDVVDEGEVPPPPTPPRRDVHFHGTYRETAVSEFTVDNRTVGTPWVAARRSRVFRRQR